MSDENLFPLFHAYNKLVRRGLTKPLTCDCGETQVTTLEKVGDDDLLLLECYSCGTTTRPGLTTINNVRAVVTEHFLDYDN
jgi:hypothetical protein